MWIVEMHRDAAVDGEFDKFDCSDREWAAAGSPWWRRTTSPPTIDRAQPGPGS